MQLPPPIHGVTVVNQAVADSDLVAARFDLDVLPLSFATSFEELRRVSLRKLGRMIEISARLAHALLLRRHDAVYFTLTLSGTAFYRDCLFVAFVKLAGLRRIYHLHSKASSAKLAASWKRRLYQWVFRDAWVILTSERLVANLEGFVPRERTQVVPNGVAPRNGPADRGEHRGRPRLLYLSNMTERKGPLVLIEALGLLRARGISIDATFAGAAREPAFLERCLAEIRRHSLERHVRYVGAAYDDHKHRLFDEHDVFVLPTCNDASPLAVLEAMQAGIPVVTTHEGALPEIVEDGATGLLVPPDDPAALADCLAALIADPDMQRRLGAQGRARYLQRYTHTAFEHNLVAALTACTRASSPRPATGEPR